MAVSAIPNNQMAMMQIAPQNGQMNNQMVSIGDLLELAIKKTYRELSNLVELLPRKTDMERKIEIMLFANRNRQLYVRLLALVKWAGSASKVEKCSQIVSFLDKQAMHFTETADNLARLSRETLVTARLPSFQLLAAVEVMTLGTYSRLPSCIRDRLVPPESISNADKRAALLRLNHIIQQRLVASELPLQMRNIKIEFGRVTFTVPNEFKLTLTLMGDNINLSWRVLNVNILVEDKEISGVRDLVQPLQIYYLQNLIQSRLTDNPKPLVEAYNILHSFSLSLQLEVLHIQSLHIYFERLKDFIRIEEYNPGNRIVISYWKDQEDKTSYKLIIEIDLLEPFRPLQIKHIPELNSKVFAKSMQANILSIEKILFFTSHERSKIKLNNLKKLFEEKNLCCDLFELPAVLHVSFIQPCMSSEQLLISIDMLTGQFLAHIPQYEDCPLINNLENCLNRNVDKIFPLIMDLRIWITRERCKKTVEALPVYIMENLPFPPNYSHESLNIVGHKIYFQFTRHHDKCLLVVFDNDKKLTSNIWFEFYLVYISNVSIESGKSFTSTPKHYMQIKKVLHLDSSNILNNLHFDEPLLASNNLKRKLVSNQTDRCLSKRRKLPGYYVAQLAHIISFCEEKLAYSCLSTELHKQKIYHQIVQDSNGYTHYIDIIKFPHCDWCPSDLTDNIQSKTLSCTICLHGKSSKVWNVILTIANPPFPNLVIKEQCQRKIVNNMYDYSTGSQSVIIKMVEDLLLDWTAIARLYDMVRKFADDLKSTTLFNTSLIEVKSFSYKKIVLGYGPSKAYFVAIYYKSTEKRFQLSFGVSNQALSNTNPHIIVSAQLQQEFNNHLSIIQLLHVLNYTLNPLITIQNLKSIPLLGVINSKPYVPVLSFCVIPQSSVHIRLIYRNTYCLDILIHPDNLVSIRDGALSQFDKSKVVEELNPIQGLKAFLNKFIDKNVQMRRLSQTEDDNPPSPVSQVDSLDNYMFPGTQIKTSLSKTNVPENSNRNAVSGNVQHSNPHTPASPLTSVLNAHSNFASSPGTFSLSSPPSHSGLQNQQVGQIVPSPQMHPQSPAGLFNINSPMNQNLHAPSPSFLPTPSPSAPSSFSHQSPASQFLSQNTPQGSGHESGIGSPFNQHSIPNPQSNISLSSPAASMWPGSPSVSRPSPRPIAPSHSPGGPSFGSNIHNQNMQFSHTNISSMQTRYLPQKAWAAAIPTLLTYQGFEMMCRPSNENVSSPFSNVYYTYSQLERFLGSTFMRRHFLRQIEEKFTVQPSMEQGSIVFKNETMQFRISLDSNMQFIHLWVNSLSDMNQWSREELDILQKFFETRVACAPYKPNAFITFAQMLNVPLRILKDFIRIMRLDLYPDRSLKWSVQFCLTFPPCSHTIPGMSAFLILKNKILIFIQLSRNPVQGQLMAEPLNLIVPMIYDTNINLLQIGGDRSPGGTQAAILNIISNLLKRFVEFNSSLDCIIFPAIKEIMTNLQLP